MKKANSFLDFAVEQLGSVAGLACRPMFGGFGLYAGERFFGIIFKGRLYFKVSETTRGRYTAAGMKPFKPSAKMTLKSFYEVPADVLEDTDQLVEWAEAATEAALSKPAPNDRRAAGMRVDMKRADG